MASLHHSFFSSYPYPVNLKVRDFVPVNLSNGNYSVWKTLMLRLIETQGLLGFITGAAVSAPDDDDDNRSYTTDREDWKRSDALLQRWIIGTINENFLPDVMCLKTAKDMWERLIALHETTTAYLYPIEVNVAEFVPIKLSTGNYLTWRRLMLHLFESRGLLGFILAPDQDKTIPPQDYLAWKRTDALMQSWILRTIAENFLAYVVDLETASKMWKKLERVFASETAIEYPYPVEINVRDFVPIMLSKENYSMWAKLMFRLVKNQGLVDFINGNLPAPSKRITIADHNSPTQYQMKVEKQVYNTWKRTDQLLHSWILETIGQKDILASVVDLETAQEIWSKLEKVFICAKHLSRPVDINVRDFVPIKLSSENYYSWKKLMLQLIESQGLLHLINGEVSKIANFDDDSINYDQWRRSDELLQRWIKETINADIRRRLQRLETSKEIWERLIILHETTVKGGSGYPYPIEVNVADFVPIKLSTGNYLAWRRLMLHLFESRGLLGFILAPDQDKTIPPQDYLAWKRTDALMQSWILRTIAENFLAYVVDLETASKMWKKLERVFASETTVAEDMYLPLYRDTLRGDWDKVKESVARDNVLVRTGITGSRSTILMVAVGSETRNHFVKNLIEIMSPEDVSAANDKGQTALHFAAKSGNLEAAKLLVEKNCFLPNISDNNGDLPLYEAASCGQRNVFLYLMTSVSGDVNEQQLDGDSGAKIVACLISHGNYDHALTLVKRYPALSRENLGLILFESIAAENSAFRTGSGFTPFQNMLYSYSNHKWAIILGRYAKISGGPDMKDMKTMKRLHEEALELVKHLCQELAEPSEIQKRTINRTLTTAAGYGICEIVEEIISVCPEAIFHKNEQGQNLIHIAIMTRNIKLFRLIYRLSHKLGATRTLFSTRDSAGNTSLDMVANFNSEPKLKLRSFAPGAALQMQRELQWFKGIEFYSRYHDNMWKIGRDTPAMVFTETHKELMIEGERWLKDNANSCTIVAALVVTIVFAAVITVPGGFDNVNGLPVFSKDQAFVVFIISDAIALLTSTSFLLIFMSIITSRFKESDFLFRLPHRFILGLMTLFISIASMMVTFGAAFHLLFRQNNAWIFAPLSAASMVPLVFFASWQYPLLLEMVFSTYLGGIFGEVDGEGIFY